MFIEVGFFLTWVYYAYTNDNFSQKKFVSGYWFQFLFILTFVHTHLILKRQLREYYFRRREEDFQKRVKVALARSYNGPRISVTIGDAGTWIQIKLLDKY